MAKHQFTIERMQKESGKESGKPERHSEFFFCRHHQEVGLKGEGTCGVQCDSYAPRNGKNGRCRHSAHCYEPDRNEVKVIRTKQTVTP